MSLFRVHYCYDSPSPAAPQGHVVGATPVNADTVEKAIEKVRADHADKLNFHIKTSEQIL